jgi:uncharacterized membrane protein
VTPEEREQLQAITQALARLVRRQEELERRLARLEGPVKPATDLPATEPVAVPAECLPAKPAALPPVVPELPSELPQEPPRNLETALGLTWLSRIAAITVVLALAFFFEYAFENHWITEWGRVLLGTACGAGALMAGERFWRGGHRTYGQALTAAGIAFLYLSFWAAYGPYHLIPQPAAFTLMVLVTAAAGLLAVRYDAPAVAMLGLAGGFATPLLLSGQKDAWFVLGYALVLDLGAALGCRARRWRWPEALALVGTLVLYVSQSPPPEGMRPVYTVFVLAYWGLFAVSPQWAVSLVAQFLGGVALALIWAPGPGGLSLALALAAGGLAVADRRGWSTAVNASFAGFWLAYAAWSGQTPNRPVASTLALLTASFLLFLGWPVWRALGRRVELRFHDLLLVALNAAFYFGACYFLLETGYGSFEGLFAVAVALLQMGAARLLFRRDARGSLLAAGAAWVLLVLAAPIQLVGYRITIAWAIEGAAVVWMGERLRDRRAVAGSLAVFLLVLGRLAAVDSRMYAGPTDYALLANARFLTFLAAAAALWGAAWWIAEGRPALAAYVAGHLVMLWGLCLEAAGWAGRTAEPANLANVASTAISVVVGAYAVLLVAAGAARRSAVTRVLGMVLIGLVVAKLYLYDVWLLGQFYRMAAFAILGVLLLAMSYLYSRFRGSIQNWWRP